MREHNAKVTDHHDADDGEHAAAGKKRSRRRRRSSPFSGEMLQMLPLMMAMSGGGMPGMNLFHLQMRLMLWMIETWMDYLSAVQEVFDRATAKLREVGLEAWDDDEDDEDEDGDGDGEGQRHW